MADEAVTLTVPEKIHAIIKYQTCPVVHQLTCGNDSQTHRPLIPWLLGDSVILKCMDCDYIQLYVPDNVYGVYLAAKEAKDYYDILLGENTAKQLRPTLVVAELSFQVPGIKFVASIGERILYMIGEHEGQEYIRCGKCRKVSYNSNDIKERYCNDCGFLRENGSE